MRTAMWCLPLWSSHAKPAHSPASMQHQLLGDLGCGVGSSMGGLVAGHYGPFRVSFPGLRMTVCCS